MSRFVDVRGLCRSFGAVQAVQDVSFSFDRGDIFGFIGPNGAGKSTTMRILATLDLPSSGDCTVGGLSTVDDAEEVRRMIGYMPDSYGAYPNMTVGEYLDFFARAYDLEPARRRRAVGEITEFCQLGGIRDKTVASLSKGMRQRLCLGRCLVHDPPLLILDEPSAGLDPRARIEFRDLLRILAGQGKAIFISSHILAELEELCSGVAIIELGRLIATGRIDDLKAGMHGAHAAEPASADTVPTARPVLMDLRLAEAREDLAARLAEEPVLARVTLDGDRAATALAPADPAAQAALLRRLIERGLPVCHFAPRDANLEDLFLHVTDGKVQ